MACCSVWLQVSGEKDFFANMVVEAVSVLDAATLDLRLIGMKKVRSGCGLVVVGWVEGGKG